MSAARFSTSATAVSVCALFFAMEPEMTSSSLAPASDSDGATSVRAARIDFCEFSISRLTVEATPSIAVV